MCQIQLNARLFVISSVHCVRLQVMKCIVEALADVLSRPQPTPVSEECLVTLKTGEPPLPPNCPLRLK